jgi:hypothetical protein
VQEIHAPPQAEVILLSKREPLRVA